VETTTPPETTPIAEDGNDLTEISGEDFLQ